jgi:hypothetical protein
MFDWLKFLIGIIVIIVIIRFIMSIYAVTGGCLRWGEYGILARPYCVEYKPIF